MTQWEKEIITFYGSLSAYVFDQLAREKPNSIKTRFDQFYREMEMLTQDGKDRNEAWSMISDFYDIQVDSIDDCVLDAVLYSF